MYYYEWFEILYTTNTSEALYSPRRKLPPRSVRTSFKRGCTIGDTGIRGRCPSPLPPLLASKLLGYITWDIRDASLRINNLRLFVPSTIIKKGVREHCVFVL